MRNRKKERKKLKEFREAVRKTEQSFGRGFDDDEWKLDDFLEDLEEVGPGLYTYKEDKKPPSGCPEWLRIQVDVRDYLAETVGLALKNAMAKLDVETLKSLGNVEFTLAFNVDERANDRYFDED